MKTLNVVAAIIKKDNKILATKRGYGEFINMWGGHGGKNRKWWNQREALIREIKETFSWMSRNNRKTLSPELEPLIYYNGINTRLFI